MIKIITKYSSKPKTAAIIFLATVIGMGSASFPLAVNAIANSNDDSMHTFVSNVHELNNTHVSGSARFVQIGREISATVDATGLEPGVHPLHIHGKDQAKAECPTISNDINGDGFISVIEGAPSYGLIKLNLTSPQTAFGKPPTPVLFYPFAGTPNNSNFPVVGTNGEMHFTGTYAFDNSSDAEAALQSLTPLGDQALVIHGATAPQSVDAPAFAALGTPRPTGYDPNLRTYDALLPAGCGTINALDNTGDDEASTAPTQTPSDADKLTNTLNEDQANLRASIVQAAQQLTVSGQSQSIIDAVNSFTGRSNQLMTDFDMLSAAAVANFKSAITNDTNSDVARNQLINKLASAKDYEISNLYDTRNQLIDHLNQQGLVNARDTFLNSFDKAVDQYGNRVEQAKNQL
ncbi:MAG: hypothetical protein NVSMB46_03740 [Candidatus Saccharimonadales bacterium]